MDDQARIQPPNYTQIPNAIFDLMADKDAGLTEAELRIILAIARKTFGWHKKRDKLSLTQLEKLTAMSRPSVKAGIDAAIMRGLVRRTPDKDDKRGGFYYELLMDEPNEQTSKEFELVKKVNQLKELTGTSKEFEPELVKNLNTQKKEKENKERGGATQANAPAVRAYFDTYPNQTLDADQIAEINRIVVDIPHWREVLRYWKVSGYRAQSIPKMLDRYSSGATVADDRPGGNRASANRPPADLPTITAASDTKRVASPEDRRRIIEAKRAELTGK